MSVILALSRQKVQEEVKVILTYIGSLKLAWATQNKEKKKTQFSWSEIALKPITYHLFYLGEP